MALIDAKALVGRRKDGIIPLPIDDKDIKGEYFVKAVACEMSSIALTQSGTVYTWGMI